MPCKDMEKCTVSRFWLTVYIYSTYSCGILFVATVLAHMKTFHETV